jgi:hypothetical protein
MTYQLDFLARQQVILVSIVGHYTVTDAREICAKVAMMLDTVHRPCYILVDLSKMKTMPSNVIEMREATRAMFTHPHFAMMASFGSPDKAVINFLGNVLARLFGITLKIFERQNDAVDAILMECPSLKDSLFEDLATLGYSVQA